MSVYLSRKKTPEPESLPVRRRVSAESFSLPSRARSVKPIMPRGGVFSDLDRFLLICTVLIVSAHTAVILLSNMITGIL